MTDGHICRTKLLMQAMMYSAIRRAATTLRISKPLALHARWQNIRHHRKDTRKASRVGSPAPWLIIWCSSPPKLAP
ncbi:hypothetical protein RJ639_011881 [Escallonia herrerae]|uniref:Uncharacterized protein n=1 Tax=Escallonia herrerae TaxID=1293975 RepID=A0AA88VJG6_9ASTE|nr:hypothetical protein RJ639_011881 [Escallonia herrerae]